MIFLNLVLVALLILLTAFFVASEFAIIRVRRSRLETRANEGQKKAKLALKLVDDLDRYLSACQLGITMTALGLGWLGEPTVDHLLSPLIGRFELPEAVTHSITFLLAFLLVTFLHVVLGELAPKTIAIQRSENITLAVARPLIGFTKLMFPLIWLLNGAANQLVKAFGFHSANESEETHSEEELRHILSESYKNGEINKSEFEYVDRIFEFDNRVAKEIMIPRTEVVAIDSNDSMKAILRKMKQNQYSRYPVIDGDKDKIIGVIHMKELFYDQCDESSPLTDYIRPVEKVFENIPIHDLLIRMQKDRTHLAILIDEYGGTSGIVTVEDILEEIVGEIRDEFDHDEERPIQRLKNGHYLVDGKVSILDINEFFHLHLNHMDVDTISGWIYMQNINANEGSIIENEPYCFKIVDMDQGQIKKVEIWENN